MKKHGSILDWLSAMGQPYYIEGDAGDIPCPSGGYCSHTYWLCGECVHDHWIGNFMFGFLGRLLSVPDWLTDIAGDWVQTGGKDDPPWDTAGYKIARNTFDKLLKKRYYICDVLKSDSDLWKQANETTVTKGGNYPKPHALLYSDCKKCPRQLPENIIKKVPGGRFGYWWPDIV